MTSNVVAVLADLADLADLAVLAVLTSLLAMRQKYGSIPTPPRVTLAVLKSGLFPYSHVKTAKSATRHVCAERAGMTVKPNRVRIDPHDVLKCPSCDWSNLHHVSVEVFERTVEDALDGVHVLVEGTGLVVNNDLTGNPSPRRHGLLIRFTCETCEATPILQVMQHKGSTYVEWL